MGETLIIVLISSLTILWALEIRFRHIFAELERMQQELENLQKEYKFLSQNLRQQRSEPA
jgi:cell division protein FtsL